ncbi:MAG TPA: Rad52/Rad22 family DNA repair protein [Pyrinomonadaceae bacterium]|nr:Rad52/Rad22 family DNA repair protein [Pyrinomonadaceae bacterium]
MSAAATATTDKKGVMRDKRAQGIAAMGLVNREGDRFRVTTPSLRGRRASYEVWRDESGKVRCSCLEFEEQSADDSAFRCEHILAVKHALLNKNTEAVTKASAQVAAPAEGVAGAKAETENTPTNTDQNAAEKPAGPRRVSEETAARKLTPRFVREQQAAPQTADTADEAGVVEATESLPLAQHDTQEEHTEMTKQRQANAKTATLEPENDLDFVTAEEHEAMTNEPASAPVVPLSFTNTLRTLKQPVDARLVKTREGWTDRNGNRHMVEYVEWHTVADILDRVAPTWSHSVRGIVQIGDMVAVTCAITIDGVTREGVGTGTADNETGIKKAEHDALKRAAIKFGIARELYQRESDDIEAQGSAPQQGDLPRDPLAKSMADLVTPKQLGMIRALAREAGVDVEEECQSVLRCRTEELSKRAASGFIDHLKGLQNASGGMRRAS